MSIDPFLQNNNTLLPRDQVRVIHVEATPYPDRRRIRVSVEVTPFRERPNLEITIRDAAGQRVVGTSVLETMLVKMEFILHMRGSDDPAGDYAVQVMLYYEDIHSPQDTREAFLQIPTDGGSLDKP